MVVQAILMPFWLLVDFLIELLPAPALEFTLETGFFDILRFGIYLMGTPFFVFAVSNALGWYATHISWAVIEWIYKKIPGVS